MPPAKAARLTKVQKARAQLLLKSPFFAVLLYGTDVQDDDTIPLAATDGRKIFMNPTTIEQQDVPVIQALYAHELAHIIYFHVPQMLQAGLNRDRWNRATDYVINLVLKDCGFTGWQGWLCEDRFKGMTAMEVYRLLEQEDKQNPTRRQGGNGQGGLDPMTGSDMRQPADGSPAATAQAQERVRQQLAQAATTARMAGKMPASLERLIQDMLEPVVPWQRYLQDYMTRIQHDDESWSRRNRRFTTYLPTRYNEVMGEVILIGDTSGSIGNEELARYAAETHAIAETMRPERIRFVWADTQVSSEQVFEQGEALDFKPTGGGGTDMRVPLEHVAQYNPAIVVLCTDGYTPWPPVDPEYPLIVLCTTNAECPVGQVIRV